MDTSTLDLYQVLQSGPYDEAGLTQIKRLIVGERRLLRAHGDLHALEQLIPMLQDWAAAAGGGWLSASALAEAAELAELDLRNLARAEQLRSQAIETGRAVSGMPTPEPEAAAMAGAIDANAELLHELKTMPPGALTQSLLTDAAEESEPTRESSIPQPYSTPLPADVGEQPTRESSVSERRSTPVPALFSEMTAPSEFPARLRSTPPPALRAVTEPRRSSSVPAQSRSSAGAAAASQARSQSVSTQPIRLSPLPRLAQPEQLQSAEQEHTQEVHTIDLELQQPPPLQAAGRTPEDALAAELAQAERALDEDASPERVRALAELYVKRAAEGDREQAADLYVTLAEVLGHPAGVAMLERALALVPDHAQAKALLTRYTLRPRAPRSSPKITVLGLQPKLQVPVPPPSAALSPPLPAGSPAPRLPGAPPPIASLAPASPRTDTHSTLPGTGAMSDVLALHGVPQVVTTPPSVPQISSLSPVVRSDPSELQARRLSVAKNSYVVMGGLALSAAAAFGLYLSLRAPDPDGVAPAPAHELAAAASQPVLAPSEPEPQTAPPAAPDDTAATVTEPSNAAQPAPLAPPGPSHLPLLKIGSPQLRGGRLSEKQLAAALDKAEPKLLACYEQAIEHKPRMKGRVIYGFTVRSNGRASQVKRVGGTIKDQALVQCSVKVLQAVRFPKPRKSAQVKLPIQYKRS